MSGANERRSNKATRRFPAEQLADLAEETAKPDAGEGEGPRTPLGTTPPPNIAQSRTITADDPMTTVLLAEVSRRSETTDFDPEEIDAVIEEAKRSEKP